MPSVLVKFNNNVFKTFNVEYHEAASTLVQQIAQENNVAASSVVLKEVHPSNKVIDPSEQLSFATKVYILEASF